MAVIDFAAWAEAEHIVPYLAVCVPLVYKVLQSKSHKVRASVSKRCKVLQKVWGGAACVM